MNIREAKQEIIHTLQAYLRRNEEGKFCYPVRRQRPILLIGPPGIGKTAIMEQIAVECGVGLVAYTITHHTRQSAIGLPRIVEKEYDGINISITEYTMSEIIASIYDCMEKTGKREGILFIDEINCVSETLAPTMLQFLQNKTFGSHRVPEGWMIVAAGNPPQFNKSVREFDIVTLDRVRKIEIEADPDTWIAYAREAEVHGAIISYLMIKKDHFYYLWQKGDERRFVTARGWEDLSELLKSYEEMQIEITAAQMIQFLQYEKIADDFAAYYRLYRQYEEEYRIQEILDGSLTEVELEKEVEKAKAGLFEEKFTLIGLLLDAWNGSLAEYERKEREIRALHRILEQFYECLKRGQNITDAEVFLNEKAESLETKIQMELITIDEAAAEQKALKSLADYVYGWKKLRISDWENGWEKITEWFEIKCEERKRLVHRVSQQLEHAIIFAGRSFDENQEMLLLLNSITGNRRAMKYICLHGCDAYLAECEKLFIKVPQEVLQQACKELDG